MTNSMEPTTPNITEITVAYKINQQVEQTTNVFAAKDAVNYLLQGYDLNTLALQEQFVVMYLSRSNAILGIYKSSIGGITGTIADVRLIFSVALKTAATAIVISHNHPSGNLNPSRADQELTEKIKRAGRLMDIQLLDHIIIDGRTKDFYSFAADGLL
jgi:DNA repair protein RadC